MICLINVKYFNSILSSDAKSLCEDYGGLLAEIRDEYEMNMLRTRILQRYVVKNFLVFTLLQTEKLIPDETPWRKYA